LSEKRLPSQLLRVAFRHECKQEVAAVDEKLYKALSGERLHLYQVTELLQGLGFHDLARDDQAERTRIRETLGVTSSSREAWDGDWGALGVNLEKVAHLYIRELMEEIDMLPGRSEAQARKTPGLLTSNAETLDAVTNLFARKAFAACAFECVKEKLEQRFPRQVNSELLETWVVDQLTEVIWYKALLYIDLEARCRLRERPELLGDQSALELWVASLVQTLPVKLPFRVTLSRRSPPEQEDLQQGVAAFATSRISQIAADMLQHQEASRRVVHSLLERHWNIILEQGFEASQLTQDLVGRANQVRLWIETTLSDHAAELFAYEQREWIYSLMQRKIESLREEVVQIAEQRFQEEFRVSCAPYPEDDSKVRALVRQSPLYTDLVRLKDRDPLKKKQFTIALLKIIESVKGGC
jgi:hypothetical protein